MFNVLRLQAAITR